MTIKPGEWITAFLSFKVEGIYHTNSSTEFPIGDAKLFVEWQQARRVWNLESALGIERGSTTGATTGRIILRQQFKSSSLVQPIRAKTD
jgi:hypothetical protein